MTIPSINNTTLNNLTGNLDVGDVADPLLRKLAFQYIYAEMQVIVDELNSIPNANLQNLAVTTAKINDLAVTTAKLNDLAVTVGKMANNSVGTAQLIDLNVTTGKLALLAVTAAQIADDTITALQLADAAVTNAKVATGIDAVKIADGSVNNTEFQYINSLTSNAQTQITARQVTSEKGQANGYAPLDSGAKVAEAYLPDSIVGQVEYMGTWNASTDTPTLPSASTVKGNYYIVSVAGTYETIAYEVGDWVISNGVAWQKVDNTDAVGSVFGRMGTVVANTNDYTWAQINKTTSSLADITTRSAGDLSSGTLNIARIGDGTLTAAKFVDGALTNDSENALRITAVEEEVDVMQTSVNLGTRFRLTYNDALDSLDVVVL
jgi:hypothetical protein